MAGRENFLIFPIFSRESLIFNQSGAGVRGMFLCQVRPALVVKWWLNKMPTRTSAFPGGGLDLPPGLLMKKREHGTGASSPDLQALSPVSVSPVRVVGPAFLPTGPCGSALDFCFPIPLHHGSLGTFIPVACHGWHTKKSADLWRINSWLRMTGNCVNRLF